MGRRGLGAKIGAAAAGAGIEGGPELTWKEEIVDGGWAKG